MKTTNWYFYSVIYLMFWALLVTFEYAENWHMVAVENFLYQMEAIQHYQHERTQNKRKDELLRLIMAEAKKAGCMN